MQAKAKTAVRTKAIRAEKPTAKRQARPAAGKLSAKQTAVKNREKIFSNAKDVYQTANYIAVVGREGTKYYKKNDENRAIARKVKGGKLRFGRSGRRYTNV